MTTILAIEDEAFIRDSIVELLNAEGYNAIGAENGVVGVRLARQRHPDLILCDVMMPELDGYGVLESLQDDPDTVDIPFIFLTARSERANVRFGMELGADDYLPKPCSPEELLRAVSSRLKKQSAQRQRRESELQQLATQLNDLIERDSLTQLPTRLTLRDWFDRHVAANGNGNANLQVPVLCVDLDRFNRINENLGYDSGDRLLQAAADRLVRMTGDRTMVARLSADEFAIILAPVHQDDTAISTARSSIERLSQPFTLDEREVFITASAGIALYPRDGQDVDRLIQRAKKAMDRAKQQGGDRCELYAASLDTGSADTLTLEAELRHAIEREELEVYYQPKVSLETGKIIGTEALLRWFHPERGSISPAQFIPVAEASGLVQVLGEWVLETACRQTRAWQQAGLGQLRVAVNLSARQFEQPDLPQRLLRVLHETRLEPQWLELELTESMLVRDVEAAIRRLRTLKALGVSVAIDDFGTGYSSLSYLQQFPFDILKIDRAFVRNLSVDAKNQAIATAILQMARQLELTTVAEGVEEAIELEFLRQRRCDEMQGYFFSRPLPSSEFERSIQTGKSLNFDAIANLIG